MAQLIPYVPFTSGSPFTPEAANAIAKPIFDGQTQYLGHLDKIADVDLDDAPGSIKARVRDNELNLKVSAGSGLNALYAAGKAIYGSTVFNINAGTITLQPSSSNAIYIGMDGVVRVSAGTLPIVRALLATVNTNTSGVTSITDHRTGYKMEEIKPLVTSVRNFGGRGDSGAFLQTSPDLVLKDGEYYFTDFTVPSGFTLYIDKLARIYCSGDVSIQGAVVVYPASSGGAVIYGGGGTFAGGLGKGNGGGQGETVSDTYNHLVSPVGSGGGGGYVASTNPEYGGLTTAGGSGGGCLWIEAAGLINITGSVIARGTKGGNASLILNNPPTYVTSAGGGGGSGGLVLLKSLTSILVSGLIDVRGGDGGDGYYINATSPASESGSGGGGGRFFIAAPAINTTGSTVRLEGGAAGANSGFNRPSVLMGIGGAGGSFGGRGGDNSGDGQPGEPGETTIRYFTPIG